MKFSLLIKKLLFLSIAQININHVNNTPVISVKVNQITKIYPQKISATQHAELR